MYCQDCGYKLTLKFCDNEGLVPYCDECGEFKFPNFRTAVNMTVVNKAQDRVLIGKHTNGNNLLFAGYIKKGESAEKAILREIREETGLNTLKYRYTRSRYHEPRNVLMLGFIVAVGEGELKLNEDELVDAKWCTFDEALEAIEQDSTAEYFLKVSIAELQRGKI